MKTYSESTRRLKLTRITTLLMAVFMAFMMAGCSDNSSTGTGTLGVSLTDAPACGFDEVNVTVSKVRVHQSNYATDDDSDWSEIILDPARKINLLDLTNGALENLGETPLNAGHYSQLRLVLAENSTGIIANSVVPTGEKTEIALVTPSGMQSGLKLKKGFDVLDGERVDLMLDFDACKSIVMRGNGSYGLKPVMQMIPFTLNGINGFVDPALLDDNVVVSAQNNNGTVVRTTVPTNPLTGEFYVARLEPGSYDVVITADDHATAVITGVPVLSATDTAIISSQAAPFSLAPSGSNGIDGKITLIPTSTTSLAEATAQQTVSLTTVTVKSQSVDLLSSTYLLTLPSAAPWLGEYGSLPIILNEQTAAAGVYSINASAPGYRLQTATTIGLAAETFNFTLQQ